MCVLQSSALNCSDKYQLQANSSSAQHEVPAYHFRSLTATKTTKRSCGGDSQRRSVCSAVDVSTPTS